MAKSRESQAAQVLESMVEQPVDLDTRLTALEENRLRAQKLAATMRQASRLVKDSQELVRFHKIRDDEFHKAANEVIESGRTLLEKDRLWTLWQAARAAAKLGLPAVEVGSFKGGSAYFLASAFVSAVGKELPVHAIDTFEGHPASKVGKDDARQAVGQFSRTDYDDVRKYLSHFEKLTVHKGEFTTVVPELTDERYGLAHIDVDLHESTRDCLEYFGPRMDRGGVIVLDDFQAAKCPGVEAAAEEYLAGDDSFQSWIPRTEQLVLIKVA
jgi:hypothetical protein